MSSSTVVETPDVKGLLASLAAFAKAAQSLPTDDDDDDALAFEASFPEFQRALQTTHDSLYQVLQSTIAQVQQGSEYYTQQLDQALQDLDNASSSSQRCSLDDPWLWEQAADACDALVEQVEAYLSSSSDNTSSSNSDAAVLAPLQSFAHQAHGVASTSKWTRLVQGTSHDWPKPQDTFHIKTTAASSRTEPFVPAVHPAKPHSVAPLDLTLQPGHGYETRFGALRSSTATSTSNNNNSNSKHWIAPAHHCPHAYEREIRAFAYSPHQLEATPPTTKLIPTVSPLKAEWIDTEAQLEALSAQLTVTNVTELALDLEAHAYRSFAGLVCLMQISVRKNDANSDIQNYLIDTLALHHCLNQYLAAPLANPEIVKILHGADHDIPVCNNA